MSRHRGTTKRLAVLLGLLLLGLLCSEATARRERPATQRKEEESNLMPYGTHRVATGRGATAPSPSRVDLVDD